MIEMPKVLSCSAEICAYNREKKCHAFAIDVGGSGPICEAFMTESVKCGGRNVIGGVGACKMKNCQFNDCLLCGAPGIHVESSNKQVICNTYKPR